MLWDITEPNLGKIWIFREVWMLWDIT